MRFGFVIPNNIGIVDPNELIGLGVYAEGLGFDSIWVNHHVLNLGYVAERLGSAPYHDALITLTWLATATSRVQLGTSVLVMPYLHPMVLAKQMATLDHLCGGRLILGLGVGSLPEENAALGVTYEDRGAYSNEFLQVLTGLWTQDAFTFAGEHFSCEALCSSPKPLQQPHPKLVIGGNRAPALRRTANFADGWHPLGITPDGVRKRMPALREHAQAAGRTQASELIQVRLDVSRITSQAVLDYAAEGVTDLIAHTSTANVADIRSTLAAFAQTHF